MSPEEQEALLHEGVSTTQTSVCICFFTLHEHNQTSVAMSIPAEIVFRDSGNSFSTGPDEVILRRSIGLKKNEYSLDKSRGEPINLPQGAGFSKCNPYYIVLILVRAFSTHMLLSTTHHSHAQHRSPLIRIAMTMNGLCS